MNKQRLLHIADVLESDRAQKHFAMANFFDGYDSMDHDFNESVPSLTNCGTTACIAGWIVNEFNPDYTGMCYSSEANRLIETDYDQTKQLFIPNWTDTNAILCRDPKLAAKVVRHFAETDGEIIWDQVCPSTRS